MSCGLVFFALAIMADGLNMGNLSLNDSQHAPRGQQPPAPSGRAPYIPPHLRQRTVNANVDGAAAYPPAGPGAYAPRYDTSPC